MTGHIFYCTARVDDWPREVRIVVTSDDGHYEVGKPE